MIKFVPVSSENLSGQFKNCENIFGYIGYDLSADSVECGKCVFRLRGYEMDILSVEVYDSDPETAEGLIRSALNYGANRSAYMAYYRADSALETAQTLGFEKDKDGILSGDIPSLLKGSCCK